MCASPGPAEQALGLLLTRVTKSPVLFLPQRRVSVCSACGNPNRTATVGGRSEAPQSPRVPAEVWGGAGGRGGGGGLESHH